MADAKIQKLIRQINEKLDAIEDLMAWRILARERFKVGQRVEFSRSADRSGISKGRKGGVRRGRIVSIDDGCGVVVLLDGYKKPTGFHHAFFNPVSGPKVF